LQLQICGALPKILIDNTSFCAGEFVIKRRADIPGNDVDCNAKNYKVLCGEVGSELAGVTGLQCMQWPGIKAFN